MVLTRVGCGAIGMQFDQLLFMTGDRSRWMVVNTDAVYGRCRGGPAVYTAAEAPTHTCVLASSVHCGPYTAQRVLPASGNIWLSLADVSPQTECQLPNVPARWVNDVVARSCGRGSVCMCVCVCVCVSTRKNVLLIYLCR